MVSALLFGGNVTVRKGEAAGGDFHDIPACTLPGQTHCVVAWSTFEDRPSAGAGFGRVPATDNDGLGAPTGPSYEVVCSDPAVLAGRPAGSPLTTLLPSQPFPGEIGVFLIQMFGGPPPTATTPWLQLADRYTATCEGDDGAHVLRVTPVGASRHLQAAPTADFGLHLADMNLPLGELVSIVDLQQRTFALDSVVTRVRLTARRLRSGAARLTARVTLASPGVALRIVLKRGTRVVASRSRTPRSTTAPVRFVVRRPGTYRVSVTPRRATSSAARRTSRPVRLRPRR